ncbi:hypothetical protein AK830_g135 [Neonectria ditissima]|uniref:Periplasmic binding protein-like II n=1 Tax=Neonectria ditissima TaxID=78410 RepID=A0A0P7BH77_9HYPO|nr:hypothetical protein AK830_g135 [Neonectria ditissima]
MVGLKGTTGVLLTLCLWGQLASTSNTKLEERSLDKIYEAVQKESGALNVVFGGSAQAAAEPLINAFQKRFPEVSVNISVQLSKYADSRIDRSYLAESPYVDVAILQTVNDFPRWEKQGLLLHYKPINFDDVNLAIKHIDGAHYPVAYNQFGPFYYDSDAVSVDKVPTTYSDVLDPFWKGKMVLTYPNDDDGVLYLFSLIIRRYGFGWLDGLLKQDVQWVRGATLATGTIIQGHGTDSTRVLSFSGLGGFTPATDFLKVKQPETPDQFMTWAQQAAIFKSTPRPESAKLFTSFLLSDEW